MVRKDTWKGVEEENITSLNPEEFLKKTTSRSRRTLKRLKHNPRLKHFIEDVTRIRKTNPKKMIKTQIRDAVILPDWVGLSFGVHNGKEYKRIDITTMMVGRRLGEFVHCTGRVLHSGPGVGATRGSKFVPLK
ncbi:ribosomal protein S19 family protein [Candidatus Micrarchaeota archaeon]|nr:ribosomal protein S19 family protein [Candidatus Micrarchaeota archaeon]